MEKIYEYRNYEVIAIETQISIARVYVNPNGTDQVRLLQGMNRTETVKQIIIDCPEFAKKYNITENSYLYLFSA